LNPTAIIEVLSKKTEMLDRKDRFKSFRRTKSVVEYVWVDQYEAAIEYFYKNENGDWIINEPITEGVLKLRTLPFELAVE
jgi:Uma2 family endonuclease